MDWMATDPNGFNNTLTTANQNNNNLLKPLIRLIKYWNTQNGYLYNSFLLEKYLVDKSYFLCTNLKEYVFNVFDNLSYSYSDTQNLKDKVDRAKKIIANVKQYERDNMTSTAESEIKKLFPEI